MHFPIISIMSLVAMTQKMDKDLTSDECWFDVNCYFFPISPANDNDRSPLLINQNLSK